MKRELADELLSALEEYKKLGIAEQIDYQKFYLYSIITHSTAIEGSTVTEVEAQLLFDEGITSGKRTMLEQMMIIDFDPINTTFDPIKSFSDPITDRLYNEILSDNSLNYLEYAEKIGVSEATVKRRLGELKKNGVIVRVGGNKTGHWEIQRN